MQLLTCNIALLPLYGSYRPGIGNILEIEKIVQSIMQSLRLHVSEKLQYYP